MLETLLTVAGSVAGILASTAIPIIVAWIASREKKRRLAEASAPLTPAFGIALSPDAERADRATDRLIKLLEEECDRERRRADEAERREALVLGELTRLREFIARHHLTKEDTP